MSILEEVQQVLVDEFELEPSRVVASANLHDDLDLDSLDGIDLIVALEQHFHVTVSEEVAKSLPTVEAVANYVERLLLGRAPTLVPLAS